MGVNVICSDILKSMQSGEVQLGAYFFRVGVEKNHSVLERNYLTCTNLPKVKVVILKTLNKLKDITF